MSDWARYFEGMTPEQIKETVASMSAEQRASMVSDICGQVNTLAASFVQNADAMWANREDAK